ncbi:predicted protein [Scheffersomyces stipitis CBS 6054]|uniref:Uncharacterized protein n=1 Tax=Scheffersomyces stipitis (strain ATCC 58785 / CBS 6054 / NBRC 10063 / NRRL Y-11545) TaxID=322104 RepID=A3LNV6_PICST|nr:predicted protein [Scheffersomyces stipitis CBS 6054]ABN64390.2 predicted protein [Scheffersomyces stipitis CBS 6054]KAG2736666.1 hypothetical protein G9P44_000756 [Scheffersomyces stipitis]
MSNYTYSEEEVYDYSDFEDIFEFNINEEDHSEVAEVSTPATLPDSPLLVPQHLRLEKSNYTTNLLYECAFCKQSVLHNHNCLAYDSELDLSVQHNNQLIQSNYRKWLFHNSPPTSAYSSLESSIEY